MVTLESFSEFYRSQGWKSDSRLAARLFESLKKPSENSLRWYARGTDQTRLPVRDQELDDVTHNLGERLGSSTLYGGGVRVPAEISSAPDIMNTVLMAMTDSAENTLEYYLWCNITRPALRHTYSPGGTVDAPKVDGFRDDGTFAYAADRPLTWDDHENLLTYAEAKLSHGSDRVLVMSNRYFGAIDNEMHRSLPEDEHKALNSKLVWNYRNVKHVVYNVWQRKQPDGTLVYTIKNDAGPASKPNQLGAAILFDYGGTASFEEELGDCCVMVQDNPLNVAWVVEVDWTVKAGLAKALIVGSRDS